VSPLCHCPLLTVTLPTDMRYTLVGALTALVVSSLSLAQVAASQGVNNPFKSKVDPYSTFINHCMSLNKQPFNRSSTVSPNTPNSEVYFQSEMKNLFPNSSITVTSDHRFNILAYAGQTEDPVLIQEMEMEGLKKLYYFPSRSRRYGQGTVASEVSLGGWNVGWRDAEFKVVFTSASRFPLQENVNLTW